MRVTSTRTKVEMTQFTENLVIGNADIGCVLLRNMLLLCTQSRQWPISTGDIGHYIRLNWWLNETKVASS